MAQNLNFIQTVDNNDAKLLECINFGVDFEFFKVVELKKYFQIVKMTDSW